MTGSNVVTLVAVGAITVLMCVLLYAEPFATWRNRRRAKAAATTVLTSPVARAHSRPVNRAERLRHLDAIWHHTKQGFINQEVGMWELEVADLQPLADGLLDDDSEGVSR